MRTVSDKELIGGSKMKRGGCPVPTPNVKWASQPYSGGAVCVNKESSVAWGGVAKPKPMPKPKPKPKPIKGGALSHELEGGMKKKKSTKKKSTKKKSTKKKSTKRKSRKGGAADSLLEGGKKKKKTTKKKSTKRKSRKGGAADSLLEGGKKKKKSTKKKSTKKKSTKKRSIKKLSTKKRGGSFLDTLWSGIKTVAPLALGVLAAGKKSSGDATIDQLTNAVAQENKHMKESQREYKRIFDSYIRTYRDNTIRNNRLNVRDKETKKQLAKVVAIEKKAQDLRLKLDMIRSQKDTYDNWIRNSLE